MKYTIAVLLGTIVSFVGSYSVSLLGACMGWFYFSEGLWLVRVSLVPCILAALLLASMSRPSRISALLVAYFTVALAASAGAIVAQATRVGIDRVNVSGYFTWCWVYAAVFLPVSYLLARLIQRAVYRFSYERRKG
ncbi:MAG: hypothetical protein EOP84_33085 [Verrucomicrobiaceae bacterium]|nr:MAG: hypothetical protein EOP84_33085 [Verrucomicrobiaceae bacterium]